MGDTVLFQKEKLRLDALASYGILDSAPEPAFDELTRLVAQVCNVSIALISMIDKDRIWFKSCFGISATEVAREDSFCECTRLMSDMLVVPDALLDKRFITNPLVTGAPYIRFYAGVPLFTPEGQILGTLCVIDDKPRDFSPGQRDALWTLSRQVMAQFELRRRTLERETAESKARENEELLRTIIDTVPHHIFAKDREGRFLLVNRSSAAAFDRTPNEMAGRFQRDFTPSAVEADAYLDADRDVIDSGVAKFIAEEPITQTNLQKRYLQTVKVPFYPPGSTERAVLGVGIDITERKLADDERDNPMRVIEHCTDFIAVSRADGSLVFMNNGARRMIGIETSDDVRRLHYTDYVPGSWKEFMNDTVLETARKEGEWVGEMQMRHLKTGALVDVSRTVFSIKDKAGDVQYFASITRDITEQKRDEALLNGQKQVLEKIATGAPLTETLEGLVSFIEKHAPGMICSILLKESQSNRLYHGAALQLPEAYIQAINGIEIGEGVGSCGTSAYRGTEVIVEDIATDPLWVNYRDLALQHGLRACWSTPLCDQKKMVLGTFACYFKEPCQPSPFHHRLINIANHVATIAINRDSSEKALRSSLERFEIVSNVSNEILWDWDIVADTLLRSTGLQKVLGYSPSELVSGFDFWVNHIHPEDRSRVVAKFRMAVEKEGTSWADEYRFERADGTYADIADCGYVLRDAQGQALRMIGAMRDVSEYKDAVQQVRKLNRVYAVLSDINQSIFRENNAQAMLASACRIAVENGSFRLAWIGMLNEATHRLDIAASAGDTDGYLSTFTIDLNDPIRRNGPTAQTIITGQNSICSDIQHDPRCATWAADAERSNLRSFACFPLKIAEKTVGSFNLYSDQSGFFNAEEVTLLSELAADISFALHIHERDGLRHRMERELNAQSRQFREMLENLKLIALTVDTKGRVTFCNSYLAELTGWTRDEITGAECFTHFNPDTAEILSAMFFNSIATDQIIPHYEFPIKTKSGETRLIQWNNTALRDVDGRIVGTASIGEDITERKKAEEGLRWRTAFFEAQVESSPDGVLVVDKQNKILLRNSLFCTIFKIPMELQAENDDLKVLQYALNKTKDPQRFLERVQYLYANIHEKALDEIEMADGTVLDRYSAPVSDKAGNYYGRIWEFRDITLRKRAEAQLRTSEEQYRLLAENAEDIVTLNGVDGNRIYVSPSYYRVTGWDSDTLQKTNWRDRMHPDDMPIIEQARAANLMGEATTIEHRIRCKNGNWIWMEARCKPLCDNDGHVQKLLLWSRDVTSRRQANEGLKASEARLNFALEASHLGAWELDLKSHVVFRTLTHDMIFGYSQLLPHWTYDMFLEHVIPTDREHVDASYREAVAKEGDWTFECRIRRVDGEIRWIWASGGHERNDQGHAVRLSGVVQDITDRRRAQSALKLSEFSVQQASLPTFWIARDAHILRVNQAACNLLGYTEAELLTKSITELDPDFDQIRWPAHWQELRELKRMNFETRQRHKNGHIIPIEVDLNWFEFEGVEYNFAFIRDLTERKKLEKRLQHSQKMEAFGLLAGGVAHDFNNMLSVVIGYSEIWLRKLPADAPIRGALATIKNAGERGAALTSQLLSFSRQSVMEPIALDLNSVVRESEKLLLKLIGEDNQLKYILDPEIPTTMLDPGQIGQVLINLAVNARDAMPRGGTITILTLKTTLSEEELNTVPNAHMGEHVMLSVIDTGCGMSSDTLSKIFEPFFTTKEVGKGTGLGLAVVHGIVTQSGGAIQVQSQPGVGTRFNLYFPVVKNVKPQVKDEDDIESYKGTETILVVEDEDNLRALTSEVLESYGYSVLKADSGQTALVVLATSDQNIDLILTDVVMPGMNGREMADIVLHNAPNQKILFMSGYMDDSVLRHGVNTNDFLFLQKPFTPFRLLVKVRKVLDSAN